MELPRHYPKVDELLGVSPAAGIDAGGGLGPTTEAIGRFFGDGAVMKISESEPWTLR